MFDFKEFFEKRQYYIKQKTIQNQFDIYKTISELWRKDYIVLSVETYHSDKEECEKLGLKTLYERFCGKDGMFCNPFFLREYMKYNQEHYGYDLDKNEQPILTHYLTKTDKSTSEFYYNYIQQGILITRIIDGFVENRKFIGIPYININDKTDIRYLDPRVIQRVNQEKSICSGETFDEALLNGFKIWTEEIGKIFFFTEQISDFTLHKIDNDDFLLFDLSYNFNIPVLLGVYLNQSAKNYQFAFASGFNFKETYNQLKINLFKQQIDDNLDIPIFNKLTSYLQKSISENALLNFISEDSYNSKIFNSDLSTSEELLKYKNLYKQLNISLYYRDESLHNGYCVLALYSLHIHLQALQTYYYLIVQHDKALYDLNQEYMIYLEPGLYRSEETLECTQHQYYDPLYNLNLLYSDISYPLFSKKQNILNQILKKDYSNLQPGNIFYEPAKRVLTTIKMLQQSKLDKETLINWLKLFDIQITELELSSDRWVPDEIVQHIYFLPLQKFLKDEYPAIVQTMIEKE